jgi:hypothetical protein
VPFRNLYRGYRNKEDLEMQRPRITKALAQALKEGHGILTGDYEEIATDPTRSKQEIEDVRRTLEYLEATIRYAEGGQ